MEYSAITQSNTLSTSNHVMELKALIILVVYADEISNENVVVRQVKL